MTVVSTYTKKLDGEIYERRIITRVDVNGKEFTIKDEERVFNYRHYLPRLESRVTELDAEIAELENEKTKVVNKIGAIKVARDN